MSFIAGLVVLLSCFVVGKILADRDLLVEPAWLICWGYCCGIGAAVVMRLLS